MKRLIFYTLLASFLFTGALGLVAATLPGLSTHSSSSSPKILSSSPAERLGVSRYTPISKFKSPEKAVNALYHQIRKQGARRQKDLNHARCTAQGFQALYQQPEDTTQGAPASCQIAKASCVGNVFWEAGPNLPKNPTHCHAPIVELEVCYHETLAARLQLSDALQHIPDTCSREHVNTFFKDNPLAAKALEESSGWGPACQSFLAKCPDFFEDPNPSPQETDTTLAAQ